EWSDRYLATVCGSGVRVKKLQPLARVSLNIARPARRRTPCAMGVDTRSARASFLGRAFVDEFEECCASVSWNDRHQAIHYAKAHAGDKTAQEVLFFPRCREVACQGEVAMSRVQPAIEQIVFARNYTVGLLDQTPQADWFRQPSAGVSHVAWQVGHLAYAEYRMALWRIRGARPEDEGLCSQAFARLFGANSVPDADPAKYPRPAEIRLVLDRVHEQALRELAGLDEAELDEPVAHPH